MKTTSCDERRCFIDDTDGSEECVLDAGDPGGCDESTQLHADGLCKEDCPYWRYPESVASAQETNARRLKVRTDLREDAKQARADKLQHEHKYMTDLAANALVFRGNFGHGTYHRAVYELVLVDSQGRKLPSKR